MCGIVGISAVAPINRSALEAATVALSHRGPDSCGVYVDAGQRVGLGHTRLSILDPSEAGRQPMHFKDSGLVITYNGEIYNFAELRRDLVQSGVTFRTECDTEVLLKGFAQWGAGILDRLNGIFAFAVYDEQSGDMFLARDHLGIKPLYYVEQRGRFVFGSELKGVLPLMDGGGDIDPVSLVRYLTFLSCPGEGTLLRDVRKLEPGFAMVVRQGRVSKRQRYWSLPDYAPDYDEGMEACGRRLTHMVDRCVERQLVADVPVGSFLSGGLDSSAIVASVRHAGHNIDCFTIKLLGGAERGTADDLPYARQVAQALDVNLREVAVDTDTMCAALADMVQMLDEPIADPACLNVFFIARLAREMGMKVLLSGAGGDDMFTGYRRHTVLSLLSASGRLPQRVTGPVAAFMGRLNKGLPLARKLSRAADLLAKEGDEAIFSAFEWVEPSRALSLLAPDLRDGLDIDSVRMPLKLELDSRDADPTVERCLYLDKRFFLADHNLLYTDKMAMAAGVEVRVPLIDKEIVEFAATVPLEWKLSRLRPKWLFKMSQRSRLPHAVLTRPKSGFGVPLRDWLKGEAKPFAEDLLDRQTVQARGLFDANAVDSLRKADANGQVDATYTLFSIMCVELWCRAFGPAHSASPDAFDAVAVRSI